MGLHRIVLLSGAAALGMMASAAEAQSTAPVRDADQRANPAPDTSGDIVVTARRRDELLTNVPVAVTALSGDELNTRRIETSSDLQSFVPSLNVSSGVDRDDVTFTIRGLGPTGGSGPGAVLGGGGAGVVSYFADTVATGAGPGLFYDLENVQVLNGPQGTLFGKNTTGGVVLFTPTKPRNDFEGYAEASYGNYNYFEAGGALNIPIVKDKLAVRLSFQRETRDGFTIDRGPYYAGKDYDNRDYLAARMSVLFTPVEGLENYTILSYLDSDQNGDGYILSAVNPANANGPLLMPYLIAQQAAGIRSTAFSTDAIDKRRNYGVINTTRLQLSDHVQLKNIVSYQVQKWQNAQDIDATPLVITDLVGRLADWHTQLGTVTEELQLQANSFDDNLHITAGGYYEDGHNIAPQPFLVHANNGGIAVYQPRQDNSERSRGLYGQMTLDLGALTPSLKGLNATAGYRRTWDNYSYGVALYTPTFGNICLSGSGVYPGNDCYIFNKGSSHGNSWTLSLDYHPAANTMIYIRSSHGYVPGGFNPALAYVPGGTDLPQFRFAPETDTDLEVGAKQTLHFAGGNAVLTGDVFQTWFNNIQRLITLSLPAGINSNYTTNAAKAQIWGFELQAGLNLDFGLHLNATYSYNKGRYTKIDPESSPALVGIPFAYLPANKASLSADYDVFKSKGAGTVTLHGDVSYQSRYFSAPEVQPLDYINAYALTQPRSQLGECKWPAGRRQAVRHQCHQQGLSGRPI